MRRDGEREREREKEGGRSEKKQQTNRVFSFHEFSFFEALSPESGTRTHSRDKSSSGISSNDV